jgi:hypothetical protein
VNIGSWCDQPVTLSDFNGDGKADLFCHAGNYTNHIMFAMNGLADFLSLISSDLVFSIAIAYNPITKGSVYIKDSGNLSVSYPMQDVQAPIYVVSSTTDSDGIGGVVTTNYQYGGLKSHLRGRGSLGFRYVKESSPDSGISVTTFYRQDFPFTGLPSQVEKRRLSDNALLSVVQNTYANGDLATSTIISKFPYLSQSVEQAYELDGSLVSTTTTTNQYDSYGNVTSVKVDDGLGNIKTTTSTYNNDVGNWLLGRLIRSTVTSVTP